MPTPKQKNTVKSRKRQKAVYKNFRLAKKIKHPKQLPSGVAILKQSFRTVLDHKRVFGGIVVISALLQYAVVQSFGSPLNFLSLKAQVEDILGDGASRLTTGWVLFGSLVGSSGSSGDVAGVYQTLIVLIATLASIWALRQILAGESIGVKDSFYKGMYPIIPFVLVIFVISVQLLPAAIGSFIYSAVFDNGLAVTALEKVLWFAVFLLLVLLSLYMILSSLFALYIVTLPEMTPLKALRSARNLVLHRRFSVALRLAVVLIVVGILAVAILLPLIIFIPVLAEATFYLFSAASIVLINTFVYLLYRELL